MTFEIALVFIILAGTIVLFVSEKLRLDLVAIMSLLALTLTGVLEPKEALAGFAEPVVIIIAALFVVGEGLFRTGVAQTMGKLPTMLAGDSEVKLIAVIMIVVAILSALMSSTGTVAVMLPVVMGIAWSRRISPSKLLIPVSVASLLGGMLTLIGTPPNIVVSAHLHTMEREPFGFFSFTPIGAIVVLVGIAFMVLIGRRLLPDRPSPAAQAEADSGVTSQELLETYGVCSQIFEVSIPQESPLVGLSLADADLSNRYGLTVVGLGRSFEEDRRFAGSLRSERRVAPGPALASTTLYENHILLLQGNADSIAKLVAQEILTLHEKSEGEDERKPEAGHARLVGRKVGIAEVILTPRSRFCGKTLKEIRFRDRFGLSVVGIKRQGQLLEGDIRDKNFAFGDTLLVQGAWRRIRALSKESRDVILVLPPEEGKFRMPLHKAPIAAAVMVLMMALMTLGIVSAVVAVLLAAVAMVLTRCVSMEDAYRSVNWESVVLIAGIIPMATALDKTGGMDLIVTSMSSALEGSGPLMLLAALFILTSILSQVISNTATAVLVAPIAFQMAVGIDANPEPFMMAIALAASTAFATPMASPVNTLVLGPGGYRFGDFFKVGVSLQVIVFIVVLIFVPVFFPF